MKALVTDNNTNLHLRKPYSVGLERPVVCSGGTPQDRLQPNQWNDCHGR